MSAYPFPLDLDSRAIREVQPFPFRPGVASGHWPCTRCMRSFPAGASYGVSFESSGRSLTFVACPDCADRYHVPRPVVIEPTELDRPPDPDLQPVVDQLRAIRAMRGGSTTDAMVLRAADVRRLARDIDTTPAELIALLEGGGFTAPPPGRD